MRLLLLSTLGVLTFSSAAFAQSSDDLTLTATFAHEEIGIEDCADAIKSRISLSGEFEASSTYKDYELRLTFDIGQDPCSRTTLNSCPKYSGTVESGCGCLATSANDTISYSGELSDILNNLGDICEIGEGTNKEIRFYLEYYNESGSTTVELRSVAEEYLFDFTRPAAPSSAPSLTAGEKAITVKFSNVSGSDISDYEVCAAASESNSDSEGDDAASDDDDDDGETTTKAVFKAAGQTNESLRGEYTNCHTVNSGVTSYRFTGLENGTTYSVVYAAIDSAGNRGENSPAATATPAPVDDFAEVYSKNGGQETGGCESTPGQNSTNIFSIILAGLALLAVILRKRIAYFLVLLALLPNDAFAYNFGNETGRSNSVEFRLGSYEPAIDSEFSIPEGQVGPYERVFGGSDWMFTLSGEQYLEQYFGTLSAGLGAGFWTVEGKGESTTEEEANDTTSFTIFPLYLQLSFRLDEWQDYVPLVPVARIGLDYFVWKIEDGAGKTAKFADGSEAFGGTWGWHYTLGVHILLDFFAEGMAGDFDGDAGVNNSYLTIEYHSLHVSDFGSSDSFRLNDDMWLFGLGFDM